VKLGLHIGYAGTAMATTLPVVQLADSLGYSSVWTAESYGSDCVTVLAYLAGQTRQIQLGTGIAQIAARTPANTAMTAMTLDALSGGRVLLGLGVSNPQVTEGWHGAPFSGPLGRTREYVDLVRRIVAREVVDHQGAHYQIPYRGADSTGLGKPLKSILHPVRSSIPIYLAAIGPRNVALAGEVADGWLPAFYSPERADLHAEQLSRGKSASEDPSREVKVAATVSVAVGDDLAACRDEIRPRLALYIGGMGAKGKNFYNDLATRYGFGSAAARIQDLYLDGKKGEAAAAVPDALVDEVSLVGPLPRILDRMAAWRESRVDTLVLRTVDASVVQGLAEAVS
jgi:F420-dependent oxidoreductase-like protein